METKYGFTKMTLDEFNSWINNIRIARTVLKIQLHHTYIPDYSLFDGNNHFERQQAMKNYHVNHNGWNDIGQHFTTFPDGTIVTGRNLETSPACIYMQNANALCIENLGNFDHNGDTMTPEQRETIIAMTSLLLKRFNLQPGTNSVIYHHWFDLRTGQRSHSSRNRKSCPGSNFFGGNSEEDCIRHFIPLLQAGVSDTDIATPPLGSQKYAFVTASALNVRTAPDIQAPRAADRNAATYGAILRVYDESNGWLKISGSQPHWVSGRYTVSVERAFVIAGSLNIRAGQGTQHPITGNFTRGDEVFVFEVQNGWAKVGIDNRWVSARYLDFG